MLLAAVCRGTVGRDLVRDDDDCVPGDVSCQVRHSHDRPSRIGLCGRGGGGGGRGLRVVVVVGGR